MDSRYGRGFENLTLKKKENEKMIINAKTEEIRRWEENEGWFISPDTGDGVKLGDWVTLGNRVKLGNWVELGGGVTLGDRVKLGDDVSVPVYCGGGKYIIHWYSPGYIKLGPLVKPFGWWTENVLLYAEEHGYTPAEQRLYQFFVRQIIDWQDAMGDLVGETKAI